MSADRPGAPSPGDAPEPVGERLVPFYCPYCGEEDLRPASAVPGTWSCGSCRRAFTLRTT